MSVSYETGLMVSITLTTHSERIGVLSNEGLDSRSVVVRWTRAIRFRFRRAPLAREGSVALAEIGRVPSLDFGRHTS
jgi:hypothetical protein